MEEKTVWEGQPSQLVNLGTFIVCGALCWTVLPIFIALAAYLRIRTTRYTLTTERLKVMTGVLSRRVDEVELYRVKDSTVVEPFLMRTQGLGNVIVVSTDAGTPNQLLHGIPNPRMVREKLRTVSEGRRDQKRVRMAEVA